jgi:hypothetical protein
MSRIKTVTQLQKSNRGGGSPTPLEPVERFNRISLFGGSRAAFEQRFDAEIVLNSPIVVYVPANEAWSIWQ